LGVAVILFDLVPVFAFASRFHALRAQPIEFVTILSRRQEGDAVFLRHALVGYAQRAAQNDILPRGRRLPRP
jgi:hypothetical protein